MTSPIETQSKQSVCSQCLGLDLAAFFKSKRMKGLGMKGYGIPIERPEKQPQSTDCAFCRILSCSIFYDLPGNKTLSSDQMTYELRAIEYPWLLKLRGDKKDRDVLALIICSQRFAQELRNKRIRKAEIIDLFNKNGHAVLERVSEEKESLTEVASDRFNARQTLNWISECKNHGRAACHPLKRRIHDLYLIDCDELAIVVARKPTRYVALSYVWASSNIENTARHLSLDANSKTPLPRNIPLVVADAITVTKSLGLRYLWVDKFCIIQDDPETKHRQISEMDAVYANSELTIIAAAGQDETYGLPGISSRSRAVTPAAEIGGSKVLWFRNPQVSIRESKWNTRGWTYQEAFLARRKLVFLDNQTYFECGKEEHCEMRLPPPLMELFNPQMGLWNTVERDEFRVFEYLKNIVGEYTARELRYDDDALLALVGILHYLRKYPTRLLHVWGIPWDYQIKREGFYRSAVEFTKEDNDFFLGLCWYHVQNCWASSGQPRRRSTLPSWSWAGWAGKVEYRADWPKTLGRDMEKCKYWLENQESHESEVGTVAKYNLSRILQYKILVLKTWAVSPDNISFSPDEDDRFKWYVQGRSARLVCLSEGADSEVQLAKELRENGELWRCVFLGRVGEGDTGNVILLILRRETNQDLWVRVGIMMLETRTPSLYTTSSIGGSSFLTQKFRIK